MLLDSSFVDDINLLNYSNSMNRMNKQVSHDLKIKLAECKKNLPKSL